ncbi:biotin/lipoyl-binding protein [Roseateles cellulosilyticus]|uniref:Biotin/lipoyl-binding protein n=1 Tax=Pelomonas cellulosilytica TaxID=2906762 RepID=A0ABS8XR32_9BURK|nr:biotin/lipoyl-binding protein [Pelomonas sp. P8]MCE4553056.1 biotin/lipoyl-binding protein [Pelomonas sp. P8]
MTQGTLSDSWYQVAQSRVALLPTVEAQAQRYRGQAWVLLEDGYSHRFYRVTPQAYEFLRALDGQHTVDETWQDLAKRHPEGTPGQEEVVRLLSQLHLSSLLYFKEQPHADAISERLRRQRSREFLGRLLSFMYWRFPLFGLDKYLDRVLPFIRACTGRVAGLVWLAAVAWGATTAFEHRGAISNGSEGLLSLSNLPWLYLATTMVKVVHELAHAFVCKRYGGQVPTFGVMVLVLAPLPYVDASASWGLRNKWQRAYVGAAGMLAELFLAALACVVWATTADGAVHSMAFNVMIVGSLSSLIFNGNPLLRYDAYYILSDLVEMPNLYQKAQAQWLHYGSKYLFGLREHPEPAQDRHERVWFTVYGALAFFYRWVVTLGVLAYVTDQWFGIGVAMVVTTAITMVLMPAAKLWAWLRVASGTMRTRALAAMGGLVVTAWLLLFVLPLPHALRLPGVLEARQSSPLYLQAPARLQELPVQHGQHVRKGQLLARFDNPELSLQLELIDSQIAESRVQLGLALSGTPAEVAPLQARLQALEARRVEAVKLLASLEVRAPQDGEWVAPTLHERLDAWVDRAQPIGEVVDRSALRFAAVLPQADVAELSPALPPAVATELRLAGRRGQALHLAALRMVPYQRQRLMSPSLGFGGGGDVAIRPDDSSGTTAAEAFFEIQAEFAPGELPADLAMHGMTGVLRVPVAPKPLGRRLWAGLQQLLQHRYGL